MSVDNGRILLTISLTVTF